MGHSEYDRGFKDQRAWNAGRKIVAKRALKPQQVWAIRFWLDQERRLRDRAMFDLAIDSKFRGCDVVKIRIGELVSGGRERSRAIVIQQKTGRPVQFELLDFSVEEFRLRPALSGLRPSWAFRRSMPVSETGTAGSGSAAAPQSTTGNGSKRAERPANCLTANRPTTDLSSHYVLSSCRAILQKNLRPNYAV
jgi:hypothetical protein